MRFPVTFGTDVFVDATGVTEATTRAHDCSEADG